jgi:hypothetical protein
MDTTENLSDAEFLAKLRIDYLQSLHLQDFAHINSVILPQFWARFSKYYEEYATSWKHLSLSRLPIRVLIDPKEQREMELDWTEQVLKGQINLIL